MTTEDRVGGQGEAGEYLRTPAIAFQRERPGMNRPDIQQRILDKSIPEPNTGCRLWIGACDPSGYGAIKIDGRKVGAHVASYDAFVGGRGELWVDHVCMQRACVNPDHLRAVTPRISCIENSNSAAAINHRKTECSKCRVPYDRGRTCSVCWKAAEKRGNIAYRNRRWALGLTARGDQRKRPRKVDEASPS